MSKISANPKSKISILIPCYNGAKYLEEAVTSILKQSYQDIEVLVLDDGSLDDSLQMAQNIARSDPRVKVFSNNKNLGIIKSRNKLLSLCQTEYAAWMDADDIAHPLRIEQQLHFMQQHSDYVACTCHYVRKTNEEKKPISIPPAYLSNEYLLFYNYVLNPGSFFNAFICKQNAVEFREWLSGASDYLFWVELAKFGKIGVVDELLMTYRIHSEQETHAQKQRQLAGCVEIVQSQLKSLNCDANKADLARLLHYPAHLLALPYHYSHLVNNAKTIKSILKTLPAKNFNVNLVRDLLLSMYRMHARRNGLLGFLYFVGLFKLDGLKQCQNYGFSLFLSSIKTDFLNIKQWCWRRFSSE